MHLNAPTVNVYMLLHFILQDNLWSNSDALALFIANPPERTSSSAESSPQTDIQLGTVPLEYVLQMLNTRQILLFLIPLLLLLVIYRNPCSPKKLQKRHYPAFLLIAANPTLHSTMWMWCLNSNHPYSISTTWMRMWYQALELFLIAAFLFEHSGPLICSKKY